VKRRSHDQQERKKESGVAAFESSLPTKKTADAGNWIFYCNRIFTSFQKMASEVANIFVNGGIKYGHNRDDYYPK
jgi:hypothetical protein